MYDVIVIGGGITGAGTARDCAMRGLKTLLLERASAGGATTASSSHLIHGGLRYLLYDRLTTHTTCWDSGHIVRIARRLLTRLPILWPVYKGHSHGLETVETLLEVYDGFQRMKAGRPHLRFDGGQTLKLVPGLAPQGLKGSLSFDEWWVDPVALVEANLSSARRHGAQVESGSPVTGLIRRDGKVSGVISGAREIQAKVVINAAGPWIDKVASMAGARIALRLRKGAHLVYDRPLTPVGLILEAVDRGRYVFVLPFKGGTLIGPTDLPSPEDPDSVAATEEEKTYLLDSVRRYLPGLRPDYVKTIVGARPILGQAGNEKLLSREFEVFDHGDRDGVEGLVTIGGGKMSDFRAMAESATDMACRKLKVGAKCRTHQEDLWGEPVKSVPRFHGPRHSLRRLLKSHPRIRELHALGCLGGALARHLILKALGEGSLSDAAALPGHYSHPASQPGEFW